MMWVARGSVAGAGRMRGRREGWTPRSNTAVIPNRHCARILLKEKAWGQHEIIVRTSLQT